MAFLALEPVSAAVYGLLNVAALQALAGGGIYDAAPAGVGFPFVTYEVQEEEQRGFGGGGLPEVQLRVRAYSKHEGMQEAQRIIAKVIGLLKDQALTVAGYTQCGRVFYDRATPIAKSVVQGIECRELVADFRIYVEE